MKEKFLILFLLGGLILVWGCGSNPTTQTNGKVFTIEYDHQVNYDVLGWARNNVENGFGQATTTLEFVFDETDLPNALIREDSLRWYFFWHVEQDSNHNRLYPGYLCGIEAVKDSITGEIKWNDRGFSTMGQGYSFVCVYITGTSEILDKTTIHELGHQRAALPHLCYDDNPNLKNPFHTTNNCVMGQGDVATCTGETISLEFCSACRNAIKNVNW